MVLPFSKLMQSEDEGRLYQARNGGQALLSYLNVTDGL